MAFRALGGLGLRGGAVLAGGLLVRETVNAQAQSPSTLPPVLVAVDTPDLQKAIQIADQVRGCGVGVKLGLEFFSANGPQGVKAVANSVPVFLDLKFHDIPNTVAGAIKASVPVISSSAHPSIINVHASGGPAMMRAAADAARESAEKHGVTRPLVIAVTILTSMDDNDLTAVGQTPPVASQVVRLAKLAQQCGMDGVVCSAKEIAHIRDACGPDFKLIVPGIRPAGSATGDQKRVMTPAKAMAEGADHLVIGRPITQASDPKAAIASIMQEMGLK